MLHATFDCQRVWISMEQWWQANNIQECSPGCSRIIKKNLNNHSSYSTLYLFWIHVLQLLSWPFTWIDSNWLTSVQVLAFIACFASTWGPTVWVYCAVAKGSGKSDSIRGYVTQISWWFTMVKSGFDGALMGCYGGLMGSNGIYPLVICYRKLLKMAQSKS